MNRIDALPSHAGMRDVSEFARVARDAIDTNESLSFKYGHPPRLVRVRQGWELLNKAVSQKSIQSLIRLIRMNGLPSLVLELAANLELIHRLPTRSCSQYLKRSTLECH